MKREKAAIVQFHSLESEMRVSTALLSVLLLAAPLQAGEFYAYYTRLPYEQTVLPEVLAEVPESAAREFRSGALEAPDGQSAAGSLPGAVEAETDTALRVPVEEYRRPTEIRWGRYADLVVSIDGGRRLVFSRQTGYLPYLETAGGRFAVRRLVEYRDDPMCP